MTKRSLPNGEPMSPTEHKVLEARYVEKFREEVAEESAQGWRVVSMAVGPTGTFTRSWKRRPEARGAGGPAGRVQLPGRSSRRKCVATPPPCATPFTEP